MGDRGKVSCSHSEIPRIKQALEDFKGTSPTPTPSLSSSVLLMHPYREPCTEHSLRYSRIKKKCITLRFRIDNGTHTPPPFRKEKGRKRICPYMPCIRSVTGLLKGGFHSKSDVSLSRKHRELPRIPTGSHLHLGMEASS